MTRMSRNRSSCSSFVLLPRCRFAADSFSFSSSFSSATFCCASTERSFSSSSQYSRTSASFEAGMSIGHKSSATGLNMTSSSGWNGLPPRFAAALRGASSSSLSSDDGAQFLPRGTLSPGRGFRQGLACVSTTKRVRRGATGRHAGRHAVRMPCAAGTHCGVEDLPSCWLMTAALRCDASAGAGTLVWLMRLPPLLRDALSESPRSIAAWPLVTRCAWGRPASTEATRQLVSTGAGPAPWPRPTRPSSRRLPADAYSGGALPAKVLQRRRTPSRRRQQCSDGGAHLADATRHPRGQTATLLARTSSSSDTRFTGCSCSAAHRFHLRRMHGPKWRSSRAADHAAAGQRGVPGARVLGRALRAGGRV